MIGDLHRVARNGNVADLQALLESGANIDARDEFGATALHYAAAERNEEAALVLVEKGADIEAQDNQGRTVLHYAVEHGQYSLAEAALERDQKAIHVQDIHGNQPLWTAAFNSKGDYRFVRLFLLFGGDPGHRNNAGLCPRDVAERFGDSELLSVLDTEPGRVRKSKGAN